MGALALLLSGLRPHRGIDRLLGQLRIAGGNVSQRCLAGVFDGKSIFFPAGHALRHFDQEPANVADLPRHAGKDQAKIAADTNDSLLGKAFQKVSARTETGDENPLLLCPGLKSIAFGIGIVTGRLSGGSVDDVKFISAIGSLAGVDILVCKLDGFDQD